MDPTRRSYEEHGRAWAAARTGQRMELAARLGRLPGRAVDLGCGPGFHLAALGDAAIGLDVARTMLTVAAEAAPGHPLVQADLRHLPFARGALDVAWAQKSYVHVPAADLPLALHDLHRVVRVGGTVAVRLFVDERPGGVHGDDPFGARYFEFWRRRDIDVVLAGSGFDVVEADEVEVGPDGGHAADLDLLLRRERTLADTVGPGMEVLVVGLNPSLHAADAGVGFVSPSNRFWPAATASGLISHPRDPRRALVDDAVGMTDLVKRATPRAADLRRAEYREGLARLERVVSMWSPGVVCVVGITGWRAATGDAGAHLGLQDRPLGGRPVYVMANPSGLNAHTNHDDLVAHFTRVEQLARR